MMQENRATAPTLLSITTTVLWLVCMTIGILGLWLHYPQPRPAADSVPPVQAQLIKVEVPPAPPPEVRPLMADANPPPDQAAPSPQAPPPTAAPAAPPLTAVAAPSPAIAFALPVEGLTRLVDASHAGFARPTRPATSIPTGTGASSPANGTAHVAAPAPPTIAAAVTHLTFGEGEGDQPLPDYPHDAVTQRQEGTVGVRLSVGEDGRVTQAALVTPCHWPLLNQSALRAVRQRWRFHPGPQRQYDVSIEFQLQH
jgi:periplasmic protein TonB